MSFKLVAMLLGFTFFLVSSNVWASHFGDEYRSDYTLEPDGFAPTLGEQSSAEVTVSNSESIYARIKEYSLPNGLSILVLPRRDLPILSFQIWYKSGSANEAEGASGIAHFLEHMYSMGTTNYEPREIDRIVRSVGGLKNASTWVDYTRYFVNVPSNSLEQFVEIEAERMRQCTFPEDKVASERNTVAEERRMRNEDDQSGAAYEKLMEMVYGDHDYAHPTVGYMADIQAYDRAKLVSYYDANYHPDNAIGVIVGDVDPDAAFKLIEKHFGALPSPSRLVNYPDAFEITQTEERRLTIEHPSPLPILYIAYPTVQFGKDDGALIDLLAEVMTGGKSGRLYMRLVRNDRLSTSIGSGHSDRRLCGVFTIRANVDDAAKLDAAEAAIYEEIERIALEGVTDLELAAAKKRTLASEVYGMQSNEGIARAIGWSASAGDWRYLMRYPEIIGAATMDDLKRIAATYFKAKTRSVVVVLSKRAANSTANDDGNGVGGAE